MTTDDEEDTFTYNYLEKKIRDIYLLSGHMNYLEAMDFSSDFFKAFKKSMVEFESMKEKIERITTKKHYFSLFFMNKCPPIYSHDEESALPNGVPKGYDCFMCLNNFVNDNAERIVYCSVCFNKFHAVCVKEQYCSKDPYTLKNGDKFKCIYCGVDTKMEPFVFEEQKQNSIEVKKRIHEANLK